MRRANLPYEEFVVLAESDEFVQKNPLRHLFTDKRCHLAHELRIDTMYTIHSLRIFCIFDREANRDTIEKQRDR